MTVGAEQVQGMTEPERHALYEKFQLGEDERTYCELLVSIHSAEGLEQWGWAMHLRAQLKDFLDTHPAVAAQ